MSKIRPPSPDDKSKDRRTYQQRIEQAFPALCMARAWHWYNGEESLHDAVDWLQAWADTRGLVELIGQDAVQAIMAEAWAPWREDLVPPQPSSPKTTDPLPPQPSSPKTTDPLPASTIDAAEYLMRERDAARFKAWVLEHTAEEQAAIVKHLENKRRPA